MSSNSLFYVCTFSLGNYTFMYRCRIADQYCCGHSCCFKQAPPDSPHLFSSWYFWSLVLVVLIVFGCIIVSFALSSLKQRADIESWSAFAGSAFNNLATTITGRHGIIQPHLHYQKRSRGQSTSSNNNNNNNNNNNSSSSSRSRRPQGTWGRDRPPPKSPPPPYTPSSMTEVSSSESDAAANSSSSSNILNSSQSSVATVSGAVKYSESADRHGLSSSGSHSDWVEIQLTPLHPAYKSSWSGNPAEVRLAASTQVFFPPGFINS